MINAQISVSAEVLRDLLDLPRSYRIVHAVKSEDDYHDTLRLLVESDVLPDVAPGDPIPELVVIHETFTRHMARLKEIRVR